ncbi:TonB-dependent receptor [Simiduia agarivorans]|uniref:TonB dependent receptor-like protein n=1 Tax=Simiduia agarivorans (strain DSM 21679 / JCM 13881 / BCRC 17597 / SA1) TaxID=1117647 RepID=K4KLL3_SIMAS|nr:TonB-dependent receptor [Simiduia agarivorans]AFU99115.1 tonB dependent receptor-like protein [Simiduia agarivorans SA1 = DSM 21679]
MKTFSKKPLALLIGAALLAGGQLTTAQENDQEALETLEEIEVVGIRRSIQNALDIKRDADTIVEAISAADMGGLPDMSIADSLARLPGVTFDRTGGQAGRIQLRGMGAGFVFSTMNGREQVTTDTRGTREIDFSQYPSELLSTVAVYKSPKASLIEGGVAGTVDMRTANPLDNAETHKTFVSLRGSYNDRADDVVDADAFGNRFTLSYMGKFLDDTLGVGLGYAHLKQANAATESIGLTYSLYEDPGHAADGKRLSEGFEFQQNGGVDERDGFVGTLVFEPTDNFTAKGDLFYSKFDTTTFASGFRVNNFRDGELSNIISQGDIVTGGVVATNPATPERINFQVINDDSSESAEILSGGLNLEYRGEGWQVSLDYAHSESEAFETDGISRSHLYNAVDDGNGNISWERDGDQQLVWQNDGLTIPNVAFNSDYTDLDRLRLTSYEVYPHLSDDRSDALRLDGKLDVDWGPVVSLEAGVRVSERRYHQSRQVFVYDGNGTGEYATDLSLAILPADVESVSWAGEFAHFPAFPAVNSQAIFDRAVAAGLVLDKNGNPRDITPKARWGENRSWSMRERADVEEDVKALYLMANLDMEVAGKALTGNVGVRIVDTEQYSTGLIPLELTADPLQPSDVVLDELGESNLDYGQDLKIERAGEKYRKVLPSLNLNYALTENDNLRFSFAKVMSRAPIAQLANVKNGSVSETAPSSGLARYDLNQGSNPFLRPFEADQVDLSYEHYFEDGDGAVVVAVYNKDVKNRIQTVTYQDFFVEAYLDAGIPRPDYLYIETPGELPREVPVVQGDYTLATNNDEGGYIRGAELAYTQTFSMLPAPFDGLGLSAGYAYVDSEITTPSIFTDEPGAVTDFPGLSPHSGNLMLFYTFENFETRLSGVYQSTRTDEVVGINVNPTIRHASTVWDYQASYKFDFGMDLVFSINNLTDEPNVGYFGSKDATGTISYFGRQYYLGVNYSF